MNFKNALPAVAATKLKSYAGLFGSEGTLPKNLLNFDSVVQTQSTEVQFKTTAFCNFMYELLFL